MGIIQHDMFRPKPSRRRGTPAVPTGQKYCAKCGKARPYKAFSKGNSADGLRSRCKACTSEDSRAYKQQRKAISWKRLYGLTEEAYRKIHEAQGGVCAICKQPETRVFKGGVVGLLSVDHDHATGQVRGLLCAYCNHRLGHIENGAWLRAALDYLDAHT